MLRYFLQRLVWVFIVLFTILTITFVFLKIQPEYPPTKYDDKKAWLVRNWTDGFMTRTIIDINYKENPDDPRLNPETLRELQNFYINDTTGKYYAIFTDQDVNKNIRILWVFQKVPISTQYFKWLNNVVTKFDWGPSTRLKINEDATTVLNQTFKYTIGVNLLVIVRICCCH
jgi:oligopeptide transport system permease protein